MKQIHNILSIAALVLAGALTTGCTDQLNDPQQPQDGTLTSLANNFDLAVYDGTLTGDAALPSGVTLSNQLCILELVLKSKQGSAVTENITGLTISDGTNTYTITPSSLEKIYVAMRPVTSTQTLTFTASGYGTSLTKEVTGQTLEKNNLYPVNLTLTHLFDLGALTGDYTAQDGDVLSGILQGEYNISTASTGKDAPAITVTLAGVDINYSFPNQFYSHGINCRRNINLVLAAGSVNYVKGCAEDSFAGILIRSERTLTISGSGSLTAIGNGGGAGICGYNGGNIKITGGTITAEGGEEAAGIGTGSASGSGIHCGNITITSNVTRVTAESSSDTYGIGIGSGGMQLCGTITIGGTVYWDGSSYQNDGNNYLKTSPLVYPAP